MSGASIRNQNSQETQGQLSDEQERHEEYERVLRIQNRLDHDREIERKEECDTILQNPLGSAQRTNLARSNEQRKVELNSQLSTALQRERMLHEQRKLGLNNQLSTALQTERTRHEQRKAGLNNQLSTALQIERMRHEQCKEELNNQARLRQQTERDAQELIGDVLHPILISTRIAASSSRSNNITSAKTIIEQELDKLMALDPDMANYDFEATFICPISASLMLDPVIVADSGNTYDRNEIAKWFRTSSTDPLTSSVVNKDLVPNNLVRAQILELLQKLRNDATAREEQRKNPRSDDAVAQQRKRHKFG